ncbi:MAG: hypothetical protein ACLQBJ_08070 [Bryobacteraceae bacterium]
MSILVGLVIITTVALSSVVFLVVCVLMAENMLCGSRTPRVTEWFLRKLHEAQPHAARVHSSRWTH